MVQIVLRNPRSLEVFETSNMDQESRIDEIVEKRSKGTQRRRKRSGVPMMDTGSAERLAGF